MKDHHHQAESRFAWGAVALLALVTLTTFSSALRFTDTYILDQNGNILWRYPWPIGRDEFYIQPATPAPTPYRLNNEPYRQTSPSWTGLGMIP